MVDAARKVPWDQRFTEHLARQSRDAANDPPLGQQIRPRYFWLLWGAFSGGALIFITENGGWLDVLGGILYLVALLAMVAARRDARASGLRREKEG